MKGDVLSKLKQERIVNFKRYQEFGNEHYLHYCCGLDRAIALLEEQANKNKKTYRWTRSISLDGSRKTSKQIVARF